MWLHGKDLLYIRDTATKFNAETSLDLHGESYGESIDGICNALINTWVTINTLCFTGMRLDGVSVFSSDRWKIKPISMGFNYAYILSNYTVHE